MHIRVLPRESVLLAGNLVKPSPAKGLGDYEDSYKQTKIKVGEIPASVSRRVLDLREPTIKTRNSTSLRPG